MIDMKWIRNDPEKVKENIRKKFQDEKLPLVDEVVELDQKFREAKVQGDELRSQRKSISKKIGALMGQGKKEEAEAVKAEVGAIGTKLEELEKAETELSARIREIMLVIPNFIDDSVPIGKDDSENVEVERFGEPLCRISKCRITWTSWKNSTASTSTQPATPAVTASIICAAILHGCTPPF